MVDRERNKHHKTDCSIETGESSVIEMNRNVEDLNPISYLPRRSSAQSFKDLDDSHRYVQSKDRPDSSSDGMESAIVLFQALSTGMFHERKSPPYISGPHASSGGINCVDLRLRKWRSPEALRELAPVKVLTLCSFYPSQRTAAVSTNSTIGYRRWRYS